MAPATIHNLTGKFDGISIHGRKEEKVDDERSIVEQRMKMVKRKKDFEFMERFKGRMVNIVQGLELHTNVFSDDEQKKIVKCVYEFQEMGRRGELRDRTYLEPMKTMRGKGRVTIQFGCCYNYDVDRNGNPPGIIRDEDVDPIPPLLKMMIKRMITWKVLPLSCIPNSCIVNIYDEEDCIPPHIDHHDFVRPFCTASFLSECKILFGTKLTPIGPGDFVGSVAIPLPVGSVLVLNGNGADVAKHCVPAVPTKRISITFRKMDESKLPYNFQSDPEMRNLRPLVLGTSSNQQIRVVASGVQLQGRHATNGNFQSQTDTSEVTHDESGSSFKLGEQDFPSLLSGSSELPNRIQTSTSGKSLSQTAVNSASPVQQQGDHASSSQVHTLRTNGSFLRVAASPIQKQGYHTPTQVPFPRRSGSFQGQKDASEDASNKSGSRFEVTEQDFPSLGSSSGSGRRGVSRGMRPSGDTYTPPGRKA